MLGWLGFLDKQLYCYILTLFYTSTSVQKGTYQYMNDQPNLLPNYFYHRLSNGIEMVGQYMPSLSSIIFGFQLDAAVIHEPEEKKGLAPLFEYMLFQGTKQKDARALNEAFESLGARKGASTGLESSQVWAQIVNTRFDATFQLINELLLTSTFPNNELEQFRGMLLQEIHGGDEYPMTRGSQPYRPTSSAT